MPQHLLQQLHAYEELLGKSTSSTPYRAVIQLISISEALAILRGENVLSQTDINIVGYLCNWINYNFNSI
jgi:hypothetical protein